MNLDRPFWGSMDAVSRNPGLPRASFVTDLWPCEVRVGTNLKILQAVVTP